MKHNVPWQLKDELRTIVLNNTATNKTLWDKLKKVLNENEDLFKHSDELTIYKYSLKKLERAERCFNFLKSGFFKREGLSGYYLITEIIKFNSYIGGAFDMKLNDGSIYVISEDDYKDLEYLIKS